MGQETVRTLLFHPEVHEGQQLIDLQRQEIRDLKEGETLRVATGEVDCDLFGQLREDLQAAHDRGVSIKMIAGPIVETRDGDNPLFDLVREDSVELYIPTLRQGINQYQAFDERAVCVETNLEPGIPLGERKGYFVEEPLRVAHHLYHFDSQIRVWEYPRCTVPEEDLIPLSREKIRALHGAADKHLGLSHGKGFDYLSPEDVEEILSKIDL